MQIFSALSTRQEAVRHTRGSGTRQVRRRTKLKWTDGCQGLAFLFFFMFLGRYDWAPKGVS